MSQSRCLLWYGLLPALFLQQILSVVLLHVKKTFSFSSHKKCIPFHKFQSSSSWSPFNKPVFKFLRVAKTAHEPDFSSTMSRTWRPNQIACNDRNPLWLRKHIKTLVYSEPISDVEVQVFQQSVEKACQEIWANPEIYKTAHFCDSKVKVLLTCMGTKQSICCTGTTSITHISAGSKFCT